MFNLVSSSFSPIELELLTNLLLKSPDNEFVERIRSGSINILGTRSLRLAYCRLTRDDIVHLGALEELRVLDLRENELDDLPGELSRLRNLRELYLGSNQFRTVPEVVYTLKSLKYLYLDNNPMSELPISLASVIKRYPSSNRPIWFDDRRKISPLK